MDPLSVTASVVGILAAAGKISELLHSVISTAKEAPQAIIALICEVNDVQAALSSLQTLLVDLASAQPHRAALIQLDQIIVTLTESVLTFSELEAVVTPLAVSKRQKFPLQTRLTWTRVEGNCSKFVERLQRHKASISLMLNILQCASDAEATQSQKSLSLVVERLLETNRELCKRLKNLEDAFDARSTVTKKVDSMSLMSREDDETITTARSKHIKPSIFEAIRFRFSFEEDLESSRVYKNARHDCCDRSFVSSAIRTHAWSIFSGLSLADISVLSVVALPLYPGDIKNQEHYSFGDVEATPLSEPAGHWTNSQSVVQIEYPQHVKEPFDGDIPGGLPVLAEHVGKEDTGSTAPSFPLATEGSFHLLQDESNSGPLQPDAYSQSDSSHLGVSMDAGPEKKLWANNEAYRKLAGADLICSCREILEKGNALILSGNRWCIDFSRCNVCGCLRDEDANVIVLDDGTLLSHNWTFKCKACNLEIKDEFNWIEHQAFCVDCFRCRICRLKIGGMHDHTREGIPVCMPCYKLIEARREELLARRERLEFLRYYTSP